MSTVKDNASVTSAGGLFKRFGRKRSASFLGSPPTSPTPDSAPFLPPLDGLEAEDNLAPPQLGYVPPPRAPRVSTSQRSTGGPPVLDLPLDLGLPAAAASKPTPLPLSPPPAPKPKPIPIVRGGPQLPPSTSIDTSLHLEVSPAGFLSTSRPTTPPKDTSNKPDPASTNARTTSPTPSTGRTKSPTPHRSPTKTRKEPNASNDKVNAAEKGGITKALGSFFKRSKTKEYSDTLSPTPAEEKRKSSAGIAALRRASVQAPERKPTLESSSPTKTNGVDKTDVPASAPTKPALDAGVAAATTSLVPTGKTFTTDDGQVRTFGEAAPSGGFARPAGYAGASAASLRAEPESDPTPVAELTSPPEEEDAFVLVPSGKTLTADEGMIRAFNEDTPLSEFARPAGFERKSAASLRAEQPEPVAPVAEAAPSGKTFTTDDGAVHTFGEAAPAGGFARPAGFEPKSASALRVAEEEPTVPVAEIASAGKTFTTDDGAVRTFGEPAPAGGFARPANAPKPSGVRALRAQFEQRKSATPSPPGSPALGSKVATPRVPSPQPEPVVEALKTPEPEVEAAVEESKVEDQSPNGDAHTTKAENGRPPSVAEASP